MCNHQRALCLCLSEAVIDHLKGKLLRTKKAYVQDLWTYEPSCYVKVNAAVDGRWSCLDCRFLMRESMSRWPAEYCSITSITSYGLKLSLNRLLDTRKRIILRAGQAQNSIINRSGIIRCDIMRKEKQLIIFGDQCFVR